MKARWLAVPLLLWLGWGFWATALYHPWQLMFESGGQFFSGVARVHLEKGVAFTRGHDWIFNEDNPYEWKGSQPLEARAYGHHPPGVGLSLAAAFSAFGQSRAVARSATIASHLVSLLIVFLAVPRWTRGRPSSGLFAALVMILVPMSGFFGRNVSHEAWLVPWVLLAVVTYVRRIERGDEATRAEDAIVCGATALASLYDWPGFYLPPILVLFEALRGRPLSRLNLWLVATTAASATLALGHLVLAAPDGLNLLLSGAQKRVDPAMLGFKWTEWVGRVRDFTVQTYTPAVLAAAAAASLVWGGRALWRRRIEGEAGAAFVTIWLVFATIHIVAFPGGSWVHPYWMFYLMPALAVAAGSAAATLWDAPWWGLRWGLRALVVMWFVEILCAAHLVLVWWLAVGAHPTGNPFIEWKLDSIPAVVCDCAREHGLQWLFACGSRLVSSWGALARDHTLVVSSAAAGALVLAWLLWRGPRRPLARDALLVLGLGAILLPITPEMTHYDVALRLAKLMLDGHVSLAERISFLEMFRFGDRFYFPYPPMTSFVLVPWALLTGGYGSQPLANTLMILCSAALLQRLMRGLAGVERWATAGAVAYALGTPLVYSAAVGNVWLTMHSQANFFLLLALWLGYVLRWEALAGFFLMVGAQCRYSVALAGVAFALRFMGDAMAKPRGERLVPFLRRSLRFCLPMAIPVAATLAFQWAAFDHPLQTAYTLSWQEWGPHGPDFSLEYFRRNLWLYLFGAPEPLAMFPFVRFDPSGQAIWAMSPFFLGVWLVPLGRPWVRHFLGGAIAMFLFYCFYWWTGFAQYGTRYMQDLYPLLVPLAFAGLARSGEDWRSARFWLVAAAVAFNLYGAYVMLHVQR